MPRRFIRTRSGPSVSKLITVPRQVRLVSLSAKNSHRVVFTRRVFEIDRMGFDRFETLSKRSRKKKSIEKKYKSPAIELKKKKRKKGSATFKIVNQSKVIFHPR